MKKLYKENYEMNEKQVSFEDFRKEQKKRERKEKLCNGVKNVQIGFRTIKKLQLESERLLLVQVDL